MKRKDPDSRREPPENKKIPDEASKECNGTGITFKNEDIYRKIFENSPLGFALITQDFRFLFVNPAWVSMTGYPEEELLKMSVQDITHPDHLADDMNYTPEFLADTIPVYTTEKRYIRRDGSIFLGLIRINPLCDSDGTPPFFAAQMEDISERRQVEDELSGNCTYNRGLIEASPDPLVTISHDGKIQDVNTATEKATGFTRNELIGTDFSKYFTEPAMARDAYGKVFTEGKLLDYPLEIRHRDGHTIPVFYNASIYYDSNGKVRGVFAAARDITELKRVINLLRESELRYRKLVENLNDVIFMIDREGLITYVSPVGEYMFGYSPPDLLGRHFTEVVYHEDIPALIRRFSEIGQGIIVPFEWRLVHKDSSHSWVRTSTRPVEDMEGTSGFLGIISDISWERKAKEALRESEDKFRKVFDWANDAIMLHTLTTENSPGRFIDVNQVACRMLGYSRDELLTMGPPAIVPPELHPQLGEIIRRAGTKKSVLFETRFQRKDGSTFPVESSGHLIMYEGGLIWISHIRDITGRKQAEEALKESEERFHGITERISDLIIIVDPEGYTTFMSPSVTSILGFSPESFIGKKAAPDIIHPEDVAKIGQAMERLKNGSPGEHVEFRIPRSDGSFVIFDGIGIPVFTQGVFAGVQVVARDVTDRKKTENVQARLISELAQKNTELDRFTYTVSHDLRSPLIAIRAFLSLLERDLKSGKTEQVQTDITRISESAEKLESLINTLLTLSRSGKSVDTPQQIPFKDLAHEAAGLLEPSWRKRGITVIIPESLPVLFGDRLRLLQVMTNLVDNAIRFMGNQKEPCINIGVRCDSGIPVFFVQDNGIGIKKEHLEKIFGLFERFNPDIPGTGIGLATVKRIIEAHSGKIWAESEGEGMGTTFCFTLSVKGEPGI
jgi:two-component system sensor kinase FixL